MTREQAIKFVTEWCKCKNWCETKMLRILSDVRSDYDSGVTHTQESLISLMRGK